MRRLGLLGLISLAFATPALAEGPALPAEAQTAFLLEAADDGRSKPARTDGAIAWNEGIDWGGTPIVTGAIYVPAAGLNAHLTIRENTDDTLPALAILEVVFRPLEDFTGGSVAQVAGFLAKNEELEQGDPLRGASARVVENHFLFAVSGGPKDAGFNADLLRGSAYIDIAIIYETGQRAILTLVQDEAAHEMVETLLASWEGVPKP